ncbi:hypothetical protein DLJ54_07965 [Corynebacterium heidelbergense]|uniref:Uncharacterized protein n=1 Tax=Corynebacterium heidelbergense TaxID=2055947 RepID=A0A364V4G7_9CORY|nr:hypothetical protein DLJ54_07965 [Corynebacterium heidelbergense]
MPGAWTWPGWCHRTCPVRGFPHYCRLHDSVSPVARQPGPGTPVPPRPGPGAPVPPQPGPGAAPPGGGNRRGRKA